MPNWCSNRVTVYSRGENVTKDIQRIREIFESKDTVFGKIIPSPDWKNTPNKNGELPKLHKNMQKMVQFYSLTISSQMVQMTKDGTIGT